MEGRHEMLVRLPGAAAMPPRRRHGLATALATMATGALLAGASAMPAGAAAERGYELVTPVEKNLGVVDRVSLSDDGDAVIYELTAALDDDLGAPLWSRHLARRTDQGWSSFPFDPIMEGIPHEGDGYMDADLQAMSADESKGVVISQAPISPLDTDNASSDLYLVDRATGHATFLNHGPASPEPDTDQLSTPALVAVTPDLSTIVFNSSSKALTPDAVDGRQNVYQWHDGTLELVSIKPDGAAYSGFPSGAVLEGNRSAFQLASYRRPAQNGGAHQISDDGSKIFWKSTNGSTAQLFVRIDGSTTQALTQSHRTLSGGVANGSLGFGTFIGATHDGSVAYFASNQLLTDTAGPAGTSAGGGIYRYDVAADDLELVTPPTAPTNSLIRDAIMSDDGSAIYFAAQSAMTPGADPATKNWYVWTPTGGTRWIASGITENISVLRVSRDGRYAVFATSAPVDGAPTNTHTQLFRYDAATGMLDCASCRPDGTPSAADGQIDSADNFINPRGITDDGTVVFTTTDHLSMADTDSAADVYAYDGDPHLVSPGNTGDDSKVYDISADGRDILFRTQASLLPQDEDGGLWDIYDARVGGGFPEPPAAPAPSCLGIGCAPFPPTRPDLPAPTSTGAGGANAADAGSTGPRLELLPMSARKLRHLARRGWATVPVRLTGGGRLVLEVKTPLGGHLRTVDKKRRHITATETVKREVAIRLSKKAGRQLRRRGHLSLRIVVRVAGLAGRDTAVQNMTLKRASR